MIPMNLIWIEMAQWLLSYSVCKVWAGQTDGRMDGDNFIAPLLFQKGEGTKAMCYTFPVINIVKRITKWKHVNLRVLHQHFSFQMITILFSLQLYDTSYTKQAPLHL